MPSWDETKPISEANLSALQNDINQANQNIIDAKTPIAAAITDKGVAASDTDSFTVLAEKIDDIELASGDAVVGDVLAGKTFSNLGNNGLIGTMPNRAGDNASLSGSFASELLKLVAPSGFYDGVDDTVTVENARRYATGNDLAIWDGQYWKLTVGSLDFEPSLVICQSAVNGISAIYRSSNILTTGTLTNSYTIVSSLGILATVTTSQGTSGNQFRILSDGFEIIGGRSDLGGSDSNLSWIAFE